MELVPLSTEEYDRARREGSHAVLATLGPFSPANRAARWRLRSN
ncbi:MAG: hypothetical protein ACOZQL_39460 [Myxococcota bacterium]